MSQPATSPLHTSFHNPHELKSRKNKGKDKEQVYPEKWNLISDFDNMVEFVDSESSDSDVGIDDMYHDDMEEVILNQNLWRGYMDLGPPSKLCNKCGATMWNEERNNKSCPRKEPTFSMCCHNGQIHFPKERPPPEPLASLLLGGEKSRHFKQYIRVYNCMFQFTSIGGKIDNSINRDIVEELLGILDKNNELIKAFRMAQNRFENEELDEFKLVLISSQSSSDRPNHITPSDEVAAFIVSDDTDTGGFRDTVVNSKQEGLKRIYETDPNFMQLQYPLLFPWGTEGYHKRIPLISNKYSEIENLDDEYLDLDSTQRRHVSLREYYCYKIMIRTSEEWPEIQEMLKLLPNVDHVDAPNIVSRVFKLKLDQLLDLIKKKKYFGKCIGVMHVIEFQKRGLPHVHMLIWMSPESRPNSIKKVDQLVSAEIPYKNSDPIAYEAVKNYMMHGPCGLMVIPILTIVVFLFIGGVTLVESSTKKGSTLTINISRSLKYLFKYCLKGHDTATMLLKKKSNKSGSEQTARSVKNLDEVKNFLDGRYVCASEASWRIFGFDIHHRSPSVECLPIDLPGQKYLNFQSSADLENVCNNATSKKSKLEAWFVANSEFPQARNFTYSDFPTQFTWI
ncbi:uncharacterized protein LOC141714445 [Apium graveolens]|uniref:uncharacterized protein LOC141714445 n=1 Tax=Apium graveolens TaxID=4045 RepID=UPI003D7AD3C5